MQACRVCYVPKHHMASNAYIYFVHFAYNYYWGNYTRTLHDSGLHDARLIVQVWTAIAGTQCVYTPPAQRVCTLGCNSQTSI